MDEDTINWLTTSGTSCS